MPLFFTVHCFIVIGPQALLRAYTLVLMPEEVLEMIQTKDATGRSVTKPNQNRANEMLSLPCWARYKLGHPPLWARCYYLCREFVR